MTIILKNNRVINLTPYLYISSSGSKCICYYIISTTIIMLIETATVSIAILNNNLIVYNRTVFIRVLLA